MFTVEPGPPRRVEIGRGRQMEPGRIGRRRRPNHRDGAVVGRPFLGPRQPTLDRSDQPGTQHDHQGRCREPDRLVWIGAEPPPRQLRFGGEADDGHNRNRGEHRGPGPDRHMVAGQMRQLVGHHEVPGRRLLGQQRLAHDHPPVGAQSHGAGVWHASCPAEAAIRWPVTVAPFARLTALGTVAPLAPVNALAAATGADSSPTGRPGEVRHIGQTMTVGQLSPCHGGGRFGVERLFPSGRQPPEPALHNGRNADGRDDGPRPVGRRAAADRR